MMGFYRNGRWQPSAMDIASGEYQHPSVSESTTDPGESKADTAVKLIAEIAHCGGLRNMSEDQALTEIRKITLPWFEKDGE